MCINGTLPLPHKWLPFPHGLRSTDISPTRGCTPATTVLEDLINAMIPWSLSLSLLLLLLFWCRRVDDHLSVEDNTD